MVDQAKLVIISVLSGLAAGISIACLVFFSIKWFRKSHHGSHPQNGQSPPDVSIREHDIDTSNAKTASPSNSRPSATPKYNLKSFHLSLWNHNCEANLASVSGIPRYSFKKIQKATENFTNSLGQGYFGTVYKAVMPSGEVFAVKVLASSNSRQGETEFQTEVSLLSRLHHRNLVNLLGYCVDKGQCMLIFEFMANGSLENVLYGGGNESFLSWEDRIQIALDISHGIEYLHDGVGRHVSLFFVWDFGLLLPNNCLFGQAAPPVFHRDLKSANILLDGSMRAKVADFGLSKEHTFGDRNLSLKGTFACMDPSYISTNKFTTKSDIYSLGIIFFELITAIHPHHNLMDYVNLASMSGDGVDEIVDGNLGGKYNPVEVKEFAQIAYKCVHKSPRKRPSIAAVVQALLKARSRRMRDAGAASFFGSTPDLSRVVTHIELQQLELSRIGSLNPKPPPHD